MKLTRDSVSGALISTDEDGYKQAKIRAKMHSKEIKSQSEINTLQIKLGRLES